MLSTLISSKLGHIGPLDNPLPMLVLVYLDCTGKTHLLCSFTHSLHPLYRIASGTYGGTI